MKILLAVISFSLFLFFACGGDEEEPLEECLETSELVFEGNHNAGLACMDCHATPAGTGAAPFTLAGTLYETKDSTVGIGGASIIIEDADGKRIQLVSAISEDSEKAGNFYTEEALTFPLTVSATECPDILTMQSEVNEQGANCNSCHNADQRIFLR